MNNIFSLELKPKTISLGSSLLLRHYKLDLMTRFMEIKTVSLKLRQDQIAKESGCSRCTLHRYKNDINMLSLYRVLSNSHKRKQKTSNREHKLERSQMTSNDFK